MKSIFLFNYWVWTVVDCKYQLTVEQNCFYAAFCIELNSIVHFSFVKWKQMYFSQQNVLTFQIGGINFTFNEARFGSRSFIDKMEFEKWVGK